MIKTDWKRPSQRARELFERVLESGEAAIDDFIEMREYETLFIDFKRSSDNGSGNRLHHNDRIHIAKAISGFGNSEGGIIVWGVDCRKGKDNADVAQFKVPINDPKRFCSWLESTISGTTMPPHVEVENHPIVLNDTLKGFVVTFVPKSNYAPHQVIANGKGQYHYFIRTGSNFLPTPHSVLAGMFGKRPQPSVFHMFVVGYPKIISSIPFSIKLDLGLQITNSGPGVASDIFMTVKIHSIPGNNCQLKVDPQDSVNWKYWSAFDMQYTAMGQYETRLPPDAILQPFAIYLELKPPFTDMLSIEGICGCENAPSWNFKMSREASEINLYFSEFENNYNNGLYSPEKGHKFQTEFWNFDSSE